MEQNKTLTFKLDEIELEVTIKDNTGWLSAKQLMRLYNVSQPTISRYIAATYKSGIYDVNITTTLLFKNEYYSAKKGNERASSKPTTLYNLDIVLELGKKFNSKNGELLKAFLDKELLTPTIIEDEETLIFNNGNINISVKVSADRETVWLSQAQIAELFDTSQSNVSMHIKNIIDEGELDDESTYKDFLYMVGNGRNYQTAIFNLDMILAVGYRVKSNKAIQFRKWATSILKQYLLKGYAINDDRITGIQYNILRLENDVTSLKEKCESLENKKRHIIFDRGQYYDAYEYVCNLINDAKHEITIIDPYFDDDAFAYLKKLRPEVLKRVCLNRKDLLSKDVVEKFKKQYGPIDFYHNKKFHDRFILIDNEKCYSIGTSLNHLGRNIFAINQIESQEIIELLLSKVNNSTIINW